METRNEGLSSHNRKTTGQDIRHQDDFTTGHNDVSDGNYVKATHNDRETKLEVDKCPSEQRRPTIWPQVLGAVVAALAQIGNGATVGYSGIMLPSMTDNASHGLVLDQHQAALFNDYIITITKMAPEWAIGESKTYQQKLLVPGTNKRKLFGILEKPNLPPSAPNVTYKLFMFGKASSGKTWTMNRLSGQEVPHQHIETVGIQCSNVYWPMKIGNRLILFRLEIWDAGESSVKRYNHVLPACREGVDAVLLCFSVTDRESWTDLPRLLTSASQPADRAAIIVVATRCDQFSHREVTEAEMESFEAAQGVPILKLGGTGDDQSDELTHTAPILNFLCKRLWQRDQELLSIKQ